MTTKNQTGPLAPKYKAVIVICTRMESSRLPGKAFKSVAGTPALEHILRRVDKTGLDVVVAFPDGQRDTYEPLIIEYGVISWQGQGDSPLHRMAAVALDRTDIEWLVRVTHDDILIDSQTIMEMLDAVEGTDYGYAYSPSIVNGAGVEVIHRSNIIAASENRKEPTEFISYFVKGAMPRPAVYTHFPRKAIQRPSYRLTMDYAEDHKLLDIIFKQLGPDATADEVCAYLDARPHLLNINRQPLVSFYTCAYNAEKWIYEAISSVMRSGIQNFEYIIVDDCSKDETVSIISHFHPDPRIKLVVNDHNLGLAASSNVAVANCRGKYVMRLDADDRFRDDFFLGFARMISQAEERETDIIYPAFYLISDTGAVISRYENPRQPHHIGCALVRKSTLNEIKFRDGLRHWDGLELLKKMRAANASIAYCDYPTWDYRQHDESMSKSSPKKRAAIRADILGPC